MAENNVEMRVTPRGRERARLAVDNMRARSLLMAMPEVERDLRCSILALCGMSLIPGALMRELSITSYAVEGNKRGYVLEMESSPTMFLACIQPSGTVYVLLPRLIMVNSAGPAKWQRLLATILAYVNSKAVL